MPTLHCLSGGFRASVVIALAVTGAVRADYPSTVLNDKPLAYYRFNDAAGEANINKNIGSLGAAGNATNLNVHPFPGAIAGSGNRSQYFDWSARTIIPWNAALNPDASQDFTLEAWFYPASDQINGGQAAINNRYAYSGVDRQGWVIFQRAQDSSYEGKSGYEGVGWNFRMYRGAGSSSGLDAVTQVPYQIGKWTHFVAVYSAEQVTNASLTLYVDGQAVVTNVWDGSIAAYMANTDDHPASEAVNGPSGLALGSYNNTQPGSNPYAGAVDELAFFSKKLTAAQILAHYQNGTNAARATAYETLVQADSPVAYLRLDELGTGPDVAVNMGDLQGSGMASNTAGIKHPAGGALAGTSDGAYSYHWRNGGGTTTAIPWTAANNPSESQPFSVEGWFRPVNDQQNPGPSPVNNRYKSSGNRTGWVMYQRAPNATYSGVSGYSGVGWTFRMYTGTGSGGHDVLTGVDYKINEWQHLVFTWEPVSDNGDGSWTGTLIAYANGVPTATNDTAIYKANTNPTEDETPPSDLAVGSYNAASGFGEDFEGDIDEFALYSNYALKPEQVLAHYQAGINPNPPTNYATLVLTAAYDGQGPQRLMPATYLRLNDPARQPAVNSGTLGPSADASLVLASPSPGPQPAAFPGFESANLAVALDGAKAWVSAENPPGLNLAGQITLEAWIQPAASQGSVARVISHGTPTLSVYTADQVLTNGSVLAGPEVFLRLEGGTNYVVGSSDGTNFHGTTFSIPADDLTSGKWVHLAGTYDGTSWALFRNGTLVASTPDAVGALAVDEGGWAIGCTGNGWADNFNGLIDEAAIYGHALTSSQIQAHYASGSSSSVRLTISAVVGGKVTLTWPSGTLQQSETIGGAFTNVSGNPTSPYQVTLPAGNSSLFYRVKL